jgi:hypothetical protein
MCLTESVSPHLQVGGGARLNRWLYMGCPSVADPHPAYHDLLVSVLPITGRPGANGGLNGFQFIGDRNTGP